MYQWTRPTIAVPVHGEAHHLSQHEIFARAHGAEHVAPARDGSIVRLAPGAPEIFVIGDTALAKTADGKPVPIGGFAGLHAQRDTHRARHA